MPITAGCPSTVTQPRAIQSSASRRDASPSSAMRLFKRKVPPGPCAAVSVWPAGMGARTGTGGADARWNRGRAGGVGRASRGSVICYKKTS